MIYYIADTHFGHENIMHYCNRPFGSVKEMDQAMADAIHRIDTERNTLIHAGDFVFGITRFYREFGRLQFPEKNILIVGNHDRVTQNTERKMVGTWFANIIGTRGEWRETTWVVQDKTPGKPVQVLVSHLPQRNLRGCDYNVYGHFHNNLYRQKERERDWLWVLEDKRYLNAGVEVTGYMPMTLPQLIEANEEALTNVW